VTPTFVAAAIRDRSVFEGHRIFLQAEAEHPDFNLDQVGGERIDIAASNQPVAFAIGRPSFFTYPV
jgi:hypothetical protein